MDKREKKIVLNIIHRGERERERGLQVVNVQCRKKEEEREREGIEAFGGFCTAQIPRSLLQFPPFLLLPPCLVPVIYSFIFHFIYLFVLSSKILIKNLLSLFVPLMICSVSAEIL